MRAAPLRGFSLHDSSCQVRAIFARTRITFEPFPLEHICRSGPCVPTRSVHGCAVTCTASMPVASPCLPPGLQAACRLRRRDIPADPASWLSFACPTPKACSRQRRSMRRNDSSAPPHSHCVSVFSSLRNPAHQHEEQNPAGPYIRGASPPPQLRPAAFPGMGVKTAAFCMTHLRFCFQNAAQRRLLPMNMFLF